MIFDKRKAFLIIIAIISSILTAPVSYPQDTEGKPIITIRVKGNAAISSATILSKTKLKPGVPFSQEVANDDIRRLYAMGYFTDVAVDVEDTEGGVIVTIIVEEKPVIRKISFEGNKKIHIQQLKKTVKLKEGDMLDLARLSEDVAEIKSLYERNGFRQTAVRYELEKEKTVNDVNVKIIIDEQARVRIKNVRVEGNKAIKTSKLKDLLETRPAWLLRRGYFDDSVFENDLNRIKAQYQDLGYLDVLVTPEFSYTPEKGEMYITLKINEGGVYKIKSVILKGNLIFPEEEIKAKISLKPNMAISYSKLRESMENVRALYYQKGYMNAEVLVDRIVDPKTYTVDIVFDINGKEIVYIGRIEIKGNAKTKDVVVRRELRSYPGDKFDGDKIKRSKERLYNLGFFEDIYFETKPTEKPNVNDLEVTVKETKTGEFSFGGGYSSIDKLIGFVQITQKNFDLFNFPYFTGDGQNLAVRAELASVKTDFDISWTEPWFFDYPVTFGLDGYNTTHWRTTDVGYGYAEARTGGDVRLGKEFFEYFRADGMYKIENVNISDISEEATQDLKNEDGSNWLSRVLLGLQYDTRDNVFSPTQGIVSTLTLENVGGVLLGNKDFVKGFWSNSLYYSPINKIVVEFSARVGLANAYWHTPELPIYERFFAGGANTIRGYGERRVGPRDPSSNDPLGGEATVIGNIEVVFPLYEKVIKGAVFYDAGNVWRHIEGFWEGGLKQGVGLGIRVKTPIGPLKLDWGYPLNENHGDERNGQFYFSVSHGF